MKEEYLTEFYKKSTVRSSMKELSLGGSSGNKENMGFPLSGYSNYSKENVACIKESLTLNYSKEGLAGKCREILNTGSCKARKSGMKQQRRSSPFRTGILRMGGIQ